MGSAHVALLLPEKGELQVECAEATFEGSLYLPHRQQTARSRQLAASCWLLAVGCWVGLGWVGLGWVGLGWIGLGWIGLGWIGFGLVWFDLVGLGWVKCAKQHQIIWSS